MASSRYPEGSITERYICQEAVTYCNLYLEDGEGLDSTPTLPPTIYDISVVSELVRPQSYIPRARLSHTEIAEAHWQVLLECNEVSHYLDEHEKLWREHFPNSNEDARKINFHPYFLDWVSMS